MKKDFISSIGRLFIRKQSINHQHLVEESNIVKLYKKRWLMLFIYFTINFMNNFQWTMYTIITNILTRYYNVSTLTINGTAIIVGILTVVFSIPVCYLVKLIELRNTVLVGAFMAAIGSWIKLYAIHPDRIVVLYIGQTFTSFGDIIISSLCAQTVTYWFGAKEIGKATSIATSAAKLGCAFSVFIVPIIVHDDPSFSIIHSQLYDLHLGVLILCTITALSTLLLFEDKPKHPPSEARAIQITDKDSKNTIWQPLKGLFKNYSFLLLLNIYGIDIGAADVILIYINSIMLKHFEGSEQDAGNIGMLTLVFTTICSFIFCAIMDRKKIFKSLLIIMKVIGLIGYVFFVISLYYELLWAVYVSAIIMGSFTHATLSVGLDFRAELTYPELDVSANLMNVSVHLYMALLLIVYNILFERYDEYFAHAYLFLTFFITFLLLFAVKDERKRQNAKVERRAEDKCVK